MATILVVDDEMGIRELLSEILNDEGHETVLAENALTARQKYAEHRLDLVLLDIWMPDTDGMSVLREWAQMGGLKCPVVMMSGHASIETALEAQNIGAQGFLEKPITLQKLLSTVQKVLSRSVTPPAHVVADQAASQALIQSLASTSTHTQTSIQTPDQSINQAVQQNAPLPQLQLQSLSQPAPSLSTWHQTLSHTTLDTSLRDFRETTERVYFEYLIEREQGNMTQVSDTAGVERTHLYRKLKQLGIDYKRKAK